MKPRPAEISRLLARPDALPGMLLYGQDPMRVAMRRQQAVLALAGADADDEMRLTRISGADLRRDPALLLDAVKAVGFFPGRRVVVIDDASDGLSKTVAGALDDWRPGDGVIVATAGGLARTSSLRKLFEGHPSAIAAPVYDDAPGEAEIAGWLADAGLTQVPREAMHEIGLLARTLDPGDLRQLILKIGLYKHGDPGPLTAAEIALLAPREGEADVDALVDLVADGRARDLGAMMVRVATQGVAPVTLCIAALRHFRALHAAAIDPGGAASGIARLRPPVFGPRRERMTRQAQAWGVAALEDAIHRLIDTDLTLRSTTRAPAMAVIERALIRLAMMPRQGAR